MFNLRVDVGELPRPQPWKSVVAAGVHPAAVLSDIVVAHPIVQLLF